MPHVVVIAGPNGAGKTTPEDTIRRRYKAGLKNFFKLYQQLADSWQIYDNSVVGSPAPIAQTINNKLMVSNF